MAKIDPNFNHDIYSFLHRPLRELDRKEGNLFLERFLTGHQYIFETTNSKIDTIKTLKDPSSIRADLLQYLKDQVGFTKDLNNITNDLSDNDLRKLITLAVALWKQKGIEVGYANIVRLFTGKSARIFNWFDFRLIVGEKAFGEEQLGEDSWLISVPGVEYSEDVSNNVVSLLTFEGNVKDRSINKNHASLFAPTQFYNTPNSGFPVGSDIFLRLLGGVVCQSNSTKYDLSGDFTIELFFRSNITETEKTLIHKRDFSGKGFQINVNKSSNSISFILFDGVTTVNGSLTPITDIDDNGIYHIALEVDRVDGNARLWFNGSESTAKISLGILSDITNNAPIYIGGESVGVNNIKCDIDNFRLSLNSVYNIDSSSITPPLSGFIEYQDELLHEFYSDIRIVDDDGTLDKTLILRILNLMRPQSERLNVIFIKFFDDFFDGIGNFITLTGSISETINQEMKIESNSLVTTDVINDDDFQDIVLQIKAKDEIDTGSVFSVLFFIQDIDNYYEYKIDTINREVSLHKVVGGVSSQIGLNISEDIVPKTSYIFTVVTSKGTTGTMIKTYVDSNLQHDIYDSSFEKGKFGMKTYSSTMIIDEIEMMEIPTDVQYILPNFDL